MESNAKAKTLSRYLGKDWKVVATGGHVQTLPHDRTLHGKDAKKAYWANQPDALPNPPWVWTDRGEKALESILEHVDEEASFWIATDPDREGEFIAWCLERLLRPHAREIHRVSFQEVTDEAVQEAIRNPTGLDEGMVESALLRKFLDRLVGYRTSKLARAVIPGGTASMGRVQTPTLGFVVDRELEREAHVPIPYFEVRARTAGLELQVRFHEPDDPEVWKNEAGRSIPTRTFEASLARMGEEALRKAGKVEVTEVTRGSRISNPRPPFSTDALLQAAGSRFGWSPKKTSALASMLYEAGHITYIRTDSTRMASSAVQGARVAIQEAYGEDHLGKGEIGTGAKTGAGPIQDAHEAIRPTRFQDADVVLDDADARKLYRLVRAHTLASQMAPSRYLTARIHAAVDGFSRPLVGTVSWRVFPGWEAVYREFRAEPDVRPPEAPLEVGAFWPLDPEGEDAPNPELIEDETQPPPRFRRHTLIRAMKEGGIGRPSTYARTVEKLEDRGYVEVEDGALAPTERGRAIWLQAAPLYVRDDSDAELFSADFTARMEERLDEVGGSPELSAASMWEEWRDEIRDLHEIARARKATGKATPRTRERLDRLLENAPPGAEAPLDPDSLTEEEARGWMERLREAGVSPAPSTRQAAFLERLAEELGLGSQEAAERIGLEDLTRIKTSAQASALIEELSALREERLPPSRKQLGLIERLRNEAGLTEEQAAALVGESELSDLTGGREGSASSLIDQLLERARDTSAART